MEHVIEPKGKLGVVIGRFQVPRLTSGHFQLLTQVWYEHLGKVLVLIGENHAGRTRRNPLTVSERVGMFKREFNPSLIVSHVQDCRTDEEWSTQVDREIEVFLNIKALGLDGAVLYGGRDSFLPHYKGKFPTVELATRISTSATEERAKIAEMELPQDMMWGGGPLVGVINAIHTQYPVQHHTVDVAIFNEDSSKLLLGRKHGQDKWRFIGGFVDPSDKTFEAAARREVQEETGLAITDPVYVTSMLADDWRYRWEEEKVRTVLFMANKMFGHLKAADDIEVVEWWNWPAITHPDAMDHWLVEEHRPLMTALEKWMRYEF